MRAVVLVSSGDDEVRLERLERGFERVLPSPWSLRSLRLGRVHSLRVAYHNAARLIGDPDTVLILAHQDVVPVIGDDLAGLPPAIVTQLQPWVSDRRGEALWVRLLHSRLEDARFGIAGVAGSRELHPGRAWWQHEALTGMVLHRRVEGIRVNAFGGWERALVLDGLCLITTVGTMLRLPPMPEDRTRFHFYDMDLCLQAHQAGLTNWTLPLLLLHDSGGASVEDDRWQHDRDGFLDRHRQSLPASVPADPLPGLAL